MSGRTPAVCGTSAGYKKHRRNGEDACEPCRIAHRDYQRVRKTNIAAGTWTPRRIGPRSTGSLAPVRVAYTPLDALVVAKALTYYARMMRSTHASHVPGAWGQAEAAKRLRTELLERAS